LYALSLLLKDVDLALPILRKCNEYFDREAEYRIESKAASVSLLRKLVFAKNYFKIRGFDLRIDVSSYEEAVKALKSAKKTESVQQNVVFDYLQKFYGSDLVKEKYINIICDRVDIYIPSQRLIIEVDGLSHYLDRSYENEFNAITETKTFMLEKSGYRLVRLENKDLGRGFEPYIQEKLALYLDTGE
jgi:very-short-patch-repair endonuclease